MKGSVTVEAAYVFPFCFFLLVMVCFIGIYQYDRAVLKMTAYECILLSMEERKATDSELKETILRRAEQAGEERAIGAGQLKTELKMTASGISLSYVGKQSILNLPIEVTVWYERIHPEITLRLTEGLTGD